MIATFVYNPKFLKRKTLGALGNLGNKKPNVRYHEYSVPYVLGTGVLKKEEMADKLGIWRLFSTVHQLLDL
jgi:hypothetical protein